MRRSKLIKDNKKAESISEILKALGHPIRIRVVAILCSGEEHVNGLAGHLGVPQAIISQQLRILRMRGLVGVIRKDGYAYYQLAEPQLKELIGCLEKCSK